MKEKIIINPNLKRYLFSELSINCLNNKDIDNILEGDYYDCSNDFIPRISSIFNDNYYYIISNLVLGYSFNEMSLEYPNIITKEKLNSFKSILEKNNISINEIVAINKYSVDPEMVYKKKSGSTEEEIIDKIYNDYINDIDNIKKRLPNIDNIFNYLKSIDYSLPLFINYDNFFEYCKKNKISYEDSFVIIKTLKKLDLYNNISEVIKMLDKALNIKLPNSLIGYKTIKKELIKGILEGNKVKKIRGKSYTSLSLSNKSSLIRKNDEILLKFYIPKGTEAISISQFTNDNNNEFELLLNDYDFYIYEIVPNYKDKNNNSKILIKALCLSTNIIDYVDIDNNIYDYNDDIFEYRKEINRLILTSNKEKIYSNFYLSKNKIKHTLQIESSLQDKKMLIGKEFDNNNILEKFIIDFSRRTLIIKANIIPLNNNYCNVVLTGDNMIMTINNIDTLYAEQICKLSPNIVSDIYYKKRHQIIELRKKNNPLFLLAAKNVAGHIDMIIISIITIIVTIVTFIMIFYK